MGSKLPLFPEAASTLAGRVDALYFFLVSVAGFFALLIAVLVITFAFKYRRRSESDVPQPIHGSLAIELTWTIIPFGLAMVMFFWGAQIYLAIARPPDDAMPVYVVGKQWMWKIQHVEGRREINELHVPVNRAVKLIMTSEDVIHSFFVPAFRIKQDVLPNRYTTLWFQATKPGRYHLFCAEYCGTQHSGMIGSIVVQDPAEYEAWLGGASVTASMATAGENLFQQLGCETCHRSDASGRGPVLDGLWGTTVQLQGGATAVVDETYVRESILSPQAKIVAGFQPIMPTFKGLVSEEGLLQLIAYIKKLGSGDQGTGAGGQGPGTGG